MFDETCTELESSLKELSLTLAPVAVPLPVATRGVGFASVIEYSRMTTTCHGNPYLTFFECPAWVPLRESFLPREAVELDPPTLLRGAIFCYQNWRRFCEYVTMVLVTKKYVARYREKMVSESFCPSQCLLLEEVLNEGQDT